MNSVYQRHSKPSGISNQLHLTNLSKLTVAECIKYIKANRSNQNSG